MLPFRRVWGRWMWSKMKSDRGNNPAPRAGEPRRSRPRRRIGPRARRFARAIAEGKSKHEAQIAAGYRPNRKNANLLMRDDRVLREIAKFEAIFVAEVVRQNGGDPESNTEGRRQPWIALCQSVGARNRIGIICNALRRGGGRSNL